MNPIIYLQRIGDFLGRHGTLIAMLFGWATFFTNILQWVITQFVSLASTFAAINFEAFRNNNFAALQLIGYVNAIVPLTEFLALLVIYLTAWGYVILFRWLKSFLPTWSN